MPITMQGAWTIRVKAKSAAFPQRFVVSGAAIGNGNYAGDVTTPPVFVNGPQWTISVQHNPPGPTPWILSAERITFPTVSAGQVQFDIQSNDSGGDEDYNDLVLTCSTPASPSDYIVYGNVKSYKGLCLFNPCYPFPWVVIDSPLALREALKYATLRNVLQEIYPNRLKELVERPGIIRPPRPEPDPAPFIPLMVPLGTTLTQTAKIALPVQEQPQAIDLKATAAPGGAAAGKARKAPTAREAEELRRITALAANVPAARQPVLQRQEFGSLVLRQAAPYAAQLSKFKGTLKVSCTSSVVPGVLLRFLEYDRTDSELVGGAYTGEGPRQTLGLAVTDERGNYIFRFTQALADLAAEFGDVVAGGLPLATQLRPDLIIQVISGGAAGVLYESPLYPDVPNLKRIDFCLPDSVLNPGPTACQGGRAIQAVGNIFTIPGVGNTLDADGRITATNAAGPNITRGAWAGTLDLFACFLDRPGVKYYTIRFRKPGGTWAFVQEQYRHIKIADIGLPNYKGTLVGPDPRNLAVDGGAKVTVPSYLNIESDPEWVITHRLRKIQLSSALYENTLYGPGDNTRAVEFRIEGYNAAGNRVTGAVDTIRLLIDNRHVTGDIDHISMAGVVLGECSLFQLTSPNAPLTARFRADQPGGFVSSYALSVRRGSNVNVPVADTTAPVQPLSLSYNEAVHGNFFFGTLNAVSPDADRYVVTELQPLSGAWLPAGLNFCAFEFAISAVPRTTNGYVLIGGYTLDKELVGISFTPTS